MIRFTAALRQLTLAMLMSNMFCKKGFFGNKEHTKGIKNRKLGFIESIYVPSRPGLIGTVSSTNGIDIAIPKRDKRMQQERGSKFDKAFSSLF